MATARPCGSKPSGARRHEASRSSPLAPLAAGPIGQVRASAELERVRERLHAFEFTEEARTAGRFRVTGWMSGQDDLRGPGVGIF